jgi:hypothetical protein
MAYYNPQLLQNGVLIQASTAATMSMIANTKVSVTAGVSYTAFGYLIATTNGRACTMGIKWYNAAGGVISTSTGGSVNDVTTGWTQVLETHVAPALAVQAAPVITITSPANGEQHYGTAFSIAITSFFNTSYFVPGGGPGGGHVMRTVSYNADGSIAAAL